MAQPTDTKFGEKVLAEAEKLSAAGKDANQIANILFQRDPLGRNYGIGIILTGSGLPAETSATLLAAAKEELNDSGTGSYLNSAGLLEKLKAQTLAWQRIPSQRHDDFILALPSDAGTGAVTTAIQSSSYMNPDRKTLGVEALSWPAYKTIAKVLGMKTKELPLGAVTGSPESLPVYQPGPHNSSGRVPQAQEVLKRAQAAEKDGGWVLLDRAYAGMEYAGLLESKSFDEVMRLSYETQIKPFIDARVPFFLAVSPTKVFVTFSLRPCGLLLAYCPKPSDKKDAAAAFNAVMRARGSAFEHPVTRAFVKCFLKNLPALESEHQAAMKRLASAETSWKEKTAGTQLQSVFTSDYAGLFRNVQAFDNAETLLYSQHLYPVFSGGRCRLNITGLPDDPAAAKHDIELFSEACRA